MLPNARQTRLLWLPGAAAACSLRHICPVELCNPDVDVHQYSQYKAPLAPSPISPSGTLMNTLALIGNDLKTANQRIYTAISE